MSELSGKRNLVRDISANTLQTGITQFFGLLIFYLTSKYLAKDDFGELNWSMAIGSTLVAIFSLGLDLIYVRRVAQGENLLIVSGLHFFHTVAVGIILCCAAILTTIFWPELHKLHPVFVVVFINLSLANIANSFKLCLNGLEKYRQLALLSAVTNVIRFVLILSAYFAHAFTLSSVLLVYVATSLVELLAAYLVLNKLIKLRIRPLFKKVEYKLFVLESLPQLGVVLFDSALARIDWILLGIISTAVATAEYSFTYKLFELSKLPLIIIAPVLLTRFSKMFNKGEVFEEKNKNDLQLFFKVEMVVVMLIPIVLVSAWTPFIDFFTDGKYGAVNELSYRVLAICVPLHAIINFLWTLGFVHGQLRQILIITVVVSILNIIANVVFIPLYGAIGSAISFLICTVIQLILYVLLISHKHVQLPFLSIALVLLEAIAACALSVVMQMPPFTGALVSVVVFLALTILTRQFPLMQIKNVLRGTPAASN